MDSVHKNVYKYEMVLLRPLISEQTRCSQWRLIPRHRYQAVVLARHIPLIDHLVHKQPASMPSPPVTLRTRLAIHTCPNTCIHHRSCPPKDRSRSSLLLVCRLVRNLEDHHCLHIHILRLAYY